MIMTLWLDVSQKIAKWQKIEVNEHANSSLFVKQSKIKNDAKM